ncbi:hypothetical protein EDD86DRAFT_207334 [Gorgonomyces haynaldii]|nr:hypothetical protein EDD86DRAFT_207334 [Gorgonomyces haynaldii]
MSCTKAEVDADGTGNKHKFNCAQRVHHNTLESLPLILTWFVCCAVHYPIVASASIGIWVLGRMAYSRGYITGEPAKRNQGAFGYIGSLGLLVGSLLSAYKTYAQ